MCEDDTKKKQNSPPSVPSDAHQIAGVERAEKRGDSRADPRPPKKRWVRLYCLQVFFNGILAVFTIAYVVISLINLYISERAYVVVKLIDNNVHDLEVGKIPWVQLAMDNEGRTPAYHVTGTQVIEIVLSRLPEKATFRRNQTAQNEVTIFPGAPLGMPASEQHSMTQIEFDGIKNGTYRACAWGDLIYRDAFSMPHYTNFCICYATTPPAVYCPYHNDAN